MSLSILSRRALTKRSRAERRRRFFLFGAIFFILAGGIYTGIRYGSFFKITDVSAEALSAGVSEEEVRESLEAALRERPLARLFGMDNIISWPRSYTALETGIPLLSKIHLRSELFPRKLFFDVTVRERFGIWCFENGVDTACSWFDSRDAILLEETPVPDGNLIPAVFEESALEEAHPLGTPVLLPEKLERLKGIFSFLRDQGISLRSARFDRTLDELSLSLYPGISVRMSMRFDPDIPLGALAALLKEKGVSKIRSIDLTVEHKLYWKSL